VLLDCGESPEAGGRVTILSWKSLGVICLSAGQALDRRENQCIDKIFSANAII